MKSINDYLDLMINELFYIVSFKYKLQLLAKIRGALSKLKLIP